MNKWRFDLTNISEDKHIQDPIGYNQAFIEVVSNNFCIFDCLHLASH